MLTCLCDIQKNEQEAHWACAMLFNGATCQLSDNWKSQKRVLERQAAAQQKKEAQLARQEVQTSYTKVWCLK